MSKKVFVVDDDSIFHFLIKRMLSTLNVVPDSIQTALSGREALEYIVTCQLSGVPLPEIILLDLNMPVMGGFEFMEAFKKLPLIDPGKTQIVITSSSLNQSDMARALQLGAVRYLAKPVSEIDLLQVLK